MSKRKRHTLKFTQRQLELMQYACELTLDGRTSKDQLTLSSIVWKIQDLELPNFDHSIKSMCYNMETGRMEIFKY
jgi:hypothetical protein